MHDTKYLTDHYDEKIKRINDIDAPINFVFITDMHHNMNRMIVEYNIRTGGFSGKKYEDGELLL